jgi:hypothetical protein
MIWISLLLIALLALGLGRRSSPRRKHALVLVAAVATVAIMYLSFAGG